MNPSADRDRLLHHRSLHTGTLRSVLPATALAVALLCAPPGSRGDDVSRPVSPAAGAAQPRWIAGGSDTVIDTRSMLVWTRRDSGLDADWETARLHCAALQGAWRLPTVAELKSVYDAALPRVPCGPAQCRVPGHFHLTSSWYWSATPVGADATDGAELAWGVGLVNGVATANVRDAAYGSRALCVHDRSVPPAAQQR